MPASLLSLVGLDQSVVSVLVSLTTDNGIIFRKKCFAEYFPGDGHSRPHCGEFRLESDCHCSTAVFDSPP